MEKDKLELRPVVTPRHYADEVEAVIIQWFRNEIYLPLMRELRAPKEIGALSMLKNSTDRDKLVDALMKGTIYYYRGLFKGKFSAETIKEMRRLKAEYSEKEDGWKVPQEKIPYPIQTAIFNSQTAFDRVLERLQKKIDAVIPANFAGSIKINKLFENIIYKVDDSVQDTILGIPGTKKVQGHIVLDNPKSKRTKNIQESLEENIEPEESYAPFESKEVKQKILGQIVISPKLDDQQAKEIAKEYTNNMELDIVGWSYDRIKEMRAMIQEKVLLGERYESIAKVIEQSYGVSARKAQFLARQETSLLSVQIKEQRYKLAGVHEYKWKCAAGSALHPVRPAHKLLDNTIQRFDNPPIVTESGKPVRHCNPGEDYNCRCTAIPIVRFDDD